jgi:hypothetical protein
MDFRPALTDDGRVAVELEPEILYLGVAKGLEDASVELVTGGVRGTEVVS